MRVKVLAAAGALLALGVAVVGAQEPRRGRPADFAAIQAEIGLTDQQVAEIRKIHGEERKAAIRRNADLRIARLELEELLAAPTLDEGKVAASVKTIADLQGAALKARTDTKLRVRKLVTPEQYQKMQQAKRGAFRARHARPERPTRHRGPRPGLAPLPPGGGEDLDEPEAGGPADEADRS